jgi:hypothetical protein
VSSPPHPIDLIILEPRVPIFFLFPISLGLLLLPLWSLLRCSALRTDWARVTTTNSLLVVWLHQSYELSWGLWRSAAAFQVISYARTHAAVVGVWADNS